MSYEIRSLSIAEVLDHSFRLIRDRFMLIWGIAAIVYIPLSVVGEFVAAPTEPGAVPPASFFIAFGVIFFVAILMLPMAQLAITHAVSETYLGRDVGIGEAYSIGRSLFFRYIGTVLLLGLGALIGFMFLVAPGIYLVVIWMLAGPVVVTEQIAGRSALGRSRALIRDNWWRGAGILLVTSILFGVVSAGLQLVFQFIPIVGPVLLGAVNALAYALSSCVLVIFYFDLRCRHEDFDLQVLREQISVESGSSSTVAQ